MPSPHRQGTSAATQGVEGAEEAGIRNVAEELETKAGVLQQHAGQRYARHLNLRRKRLQILQGSGQLSAVLFQQRQVVGDAKRIVA